MATHTPGPWMLTSARYGLISNANDLPVATLSRPVGGSASEEKRNMDTMMANARLIAAAPELLAELREARKEIKRYRAVLEDILRFWYHGGDAGKLAKIALAETPNGDPFTLIDAAIAKAEGR